LVFPRGKSLTDKESIDVLKGSALDIYRFMLKTNKAMGVREVARSLNLSSPSVAQYHLSKLEEMGLIRREWGNYVINKVELENCIKFNRFLIPRYFIYTLFFTLVLTVELTLLRPNVLYQGYIFAIFATLVAMTIFCYETIKIWRKGSL